MSLAQLKPGQWGRGFPDDQVPSHVDVIRFKGAFDYTYLFRTLQRWFEQRRFRFYEQRIKDTGKRIKHDLMAERQLDEWYEEQYGIKVEMWNLSSQEIIVNGEPRKILVGMAQFTVNGKVRGDRLGLYKHGGKFVKFIGKLMMDVRWRELEMTGIDVIEYRTHDIVTVIKECLNMTTKENAPW